MDKSLCMNIENIDNTNDPLWDPLEIKYNDLLVKEEVSAYVPISNQIYGLKSEAVLETKLFESNENQIYYEIPEETKPNLPICACIKSIESRRDENILPDGLINSQVKSEKSQMGISASRTSRDDRTHSSNYFTENSHENFCSEERENKHSVTNDDFTLTSLRKIRNIKHGHVYKEPCDLSRLQSDKKYQENNTTPCTDVSECHVCGKFFFRKHNLNRHLKVHGFSNVCIECGKHLPNSKKFIGHIKTHAKASSCFTCPECGKSCRNKFNFEVHLRVHSGSKPFSCDECGKCFSQSSQIILHKRVHTGNTPYSCNVCDKSFTQKNKLEIHLRTHTGYKPYQCSYCEKKFSDPSAFRRHQITHTGKKPYSCDECPKSFADNASLFRHKKLHAQCRDFVCDYCGKCFVLRSYLVSHIRKHMKEKQHECSVCQKRYAHKCSLDRHLVTHFKLKSQTEISQDYET